MEAEMSETGPAREVPRRSPVIKRKFSAKKKDGPKVAGGCLPLQTVGGRGEINLTILGTRSEIGNGVESRRFKSKESVHACRSRGGSAGFKSCHCPRESESHQLMRLCRFTLTRTHNQTPPGAHATQLQTGLSKERGLAGTRATKSPVWDGTSGRSPLPVSLRL